MPTYEFKCMNCAEVTELFYKTISAADGVEGTVCPACGGMARRANITAPLPAHLYGNPDGYHKPSATKRFNTKTVSQKTGNDCAIG